MRRLRAAKEAGSVGTWARAPYACSLRSLPELEEAGYPTLVTRQTRHANNGRRLGTSEICIDLTFHSPL